jgi:Leucine-rich repeat (LRR) protein
MELLMQHLIIYQLVLIYLSKFFVNKMRKLALLGLVILYSTINLYGQRQQDSLALVALYNSAGGINWTDKTNWLSSEPINTWHGVKVLNNRVTEVNLGFNNLIGIIPREIGNLTNLQSLVLYNNQLSGSIPAEIGNLTNLQSLTLYNSQLSGSIPSEIGNLTNLHVLVLYNNQLSGYIPTEIGNLRNLTHIFLNNNQLSGSIPAEIGNLINLAYLHLYTNKLSGPIPAEIGNLINLQSLVIYSNKLSGSVLTEIGNLINLQRLDLHYNQLSGSIPKEIGNLINLSILDLNFNALSGSIPTEIGNLINLTRLWLSSNQLSGSVPGSINNLTKLSELNLSQNSLDELPSLALPSLETFYIQSNHLTFEDIEPNINIAKVFEYSGQVNIGIQIDTILNMGEDFTFMVTCSGANNQYQWYYNSVPIPTATSNTYTISNLQTSDAGLYYCTVTNTIATALTIYSRNTHISISAPTDVNDIEFIGIKIYPNPTEGLLKIELEKDFHGGNSIEVYDFYGKRIIQKPLEDRFYHEIDLSRFPNGIYYLRIKNGKNSYSRKVIIH